MFPDWQDRKRARDDEPDDYEYGTGFGEHRIVSRYNRQSNPPNYQTDHLQKRRLAALPHRASPSFTRHATPPSFSFTSYTGPPAPPTITPADSESEGTPRETKSFFSPYSSPPGESLSQYASPDIRPAQYGESTQMTYGTDDMDMADETDVVHFSPQASPYQQAQSISGRIPTPIHSSFTRSMRVEKVPHTSSEDNFADDEAFINRFKRGRRLPSPISEGEMSPSVLIDGMEDMQMEVDRMPSQSEPPCDLTTTPTKKGHQRSKHSVRQWSGFGGDLQSAGQGVKRSFSMGYRADCDKCRLKVPGHFSHIITYGD